MDNRPGEKEDKKKIEENLMDTIENANFEEIERSVTPRKFQECKSNSLAIGMKVNFGLRKRAAGMGPDKERFNQLANSVEEFTASLLDPLRSDKDRCAQFGDHILDRILDVAIKNKQKKFFTHPVVHEEMNRKWHGRKFLQRKWRWWQRLLFSIWCLFDLVFSPILFSVFSLIKEKEERDKKEEKPTPAEIVIVPKTQKTRVGDPVKFECKIPENSLRTTTWYKDQEELGKRSPLIIESVKTSDKGRYRCVVHVTNDAGQAIRACERTSTLTVDPLFLIYLDYLETPYYKFVRDTLSYLFLLALHFALCLEPSTKAITGLEWTVFVFFVGRYLVERKQICQQRATYFSDCWNRLDLISLLIYLVIFLLRIGTVIMPTPVANNRALALVGYLYGFNTLCLTLRTFGHVMEQSKLVGTIQIALFSILKEIQIVFGQFAAILLAFSIAVTKVYMTEKSFLANESGGKDTVCSKSGVSCWWSMFTHLGWSLLGPSGEVDRLTSVDQLSETIARIFFAVFLIIGVILLINMLIALLSHTYQRTEENSFKEWSFQRAISIQTYDAYDPIPVPLNIIYNIGKLLWPVVQRCLNLEKEKEEKKGTNEKMFFTHLEEKYFEKHTNLFPVTDAKKLDLMLHETERNRQMISQILCTTFKPQEGDKEMLVDRGPEAWDCHSKIRIEGLLLTCEDNKPKEKQVPGARFQIPFSSKLPYFEVVILETKNNGQVGIGVVNKDYDNLAMPGWEDNSLGYHTSDGKFFYNCEEDDRELETEGPAMARRGDLIRCTIREKNSDGEFSFLFTLNGRKIRMKDVEEKVITLKKDKGPYYPYIALADGCSVLARMLHSGK